MKGNEREKWQSASVGALLVHEFVYYNDRT